MRILAIGLGGAGCRIVNSLYSTDRRSSKVLCVQVLAIDVNSETLAQLGGLPDSAKLFFPPIDLDLQPELNKDSQTATIDIGEIVARIQNIEIGETDAIFVCCGLGGSMVDVAPHIIAALRSSITEPIFGLVTLPCLAEGERHSAKAADDLDMLTPLLDGIILFDNETWYKKIKARKSTLTKKEKGMAEKLGFRKSEQEISPQLATYLLLNEGIVRRISLILRAGEFKADGGLDFAEVVLDSGEVLNTMKGMGYITIGYAVEHLPHNPLSFLTSWRPTGFFADEHVKRASRIVDLAKQAIYHEISTPCDMTSAHKALILIAGPSHELSLKGFMTVRKWIDKSIAGLETRSGDYPVMNTKNVAIIIMLSGLENIPRVTELKEIQNQYKANRQDNVIGIKQSGFDSILVSENTGITSNVEPSTKRGVKKAKDEILILPLKMHKKEAFYSIDSENFLDQEEEDYLPDIDDHEQVIQSNIIVQQNILPDQTTAAKKTVPHLTPKSQSSKETTQPASVGEISTPKIPGSPVSRNRIVVAKDQVSQNLQSVSHIKFPGPSVHEKPQNKKSTYIKDSRGFDEKHLPHISDDRSRTKEMERQIIEKELQRQRMMAIPGRTPKKASEMSSSTPTPEIIRLKNEVPDKSSHKNDHGQPDSDEVVHQVHKKRTVIIHKKKVNPAVQETLVPYDGKGDVLAEDDTINDIKSPEVNSRQMDSEELKVSIKNSVYKSKDEIFEGKRIQRKSTPQVRDSALIHTNLKNKKTIGESKNVEGDHEIDDHFTETSDTHKRREKNTSQKDDISWI
jgi:cell division GTPase FtsZ